jgi:hypothetical protein
MKHRKFDLEKELRATRSEPRVEFARALADQVRGSRAETRSPLGRLGLVLALSGLIVVALASFGGISYASSSASHAVKKPAAKHVAVEEKSAAHAQYAPFKPPAAKPKPSSTPPASGAEGSEGAATPPAAVAVKSSQLPFTGLALWVPIAIGLLLVAVGLALRTRDRRRDVGTQ